MIGKEEHTRIAQIIAGQTHRRILDGKHRIPTVDKMGLVERLGQYLGVNNPDFNREDFEAMCCKE